MRPSQRRTRSKGVAGCCARRGTLAARHRAPGRERVSLGPATADSPPPFPCRTEERPKSARQCQTRPFLPLAPQCDLEPKKKKKKATPSLALGVRDDAVGIVSLAHSGPNNKKLLFLLSAPRTPASPLSAPFPFQGIRDGPGFHRLLH